jgi:hypothetical protein
VDVGGWKILSAADTDNGVFSVVTESTTQVLCGDLLLI